MGIKAQNGDWIIGTSPVARGSKLVYAMQVAETLSFDQYFADVRFGEKKPVINGSWKEQCGDNMYSKNAQGQWIQGPTIHHREPELVEKDLKHPTVFIANHYYYFGDKASVIPAEFKTLVLNRQGCKKDFDAKIVKMFVNWLTNNFKPGIQGNPSDQEECKSDCS